MFRYHLPQSWVVVASCSALAAAIFLARCAIAAPGDVVDLEGDTTHHNPPASTTDSPTSTRPRVTATEPEQVPAIGKNDSTDKARQDAAEKKLKLRAGERVGDDARGSAQVLGMSLQEGPHGRLKVVEVAMNSPAFDAGVMKGDEVVAFQGFRGESYRKWIDGIRRLTTDTAAGLKIPVVVARDGNQITVPIVVPEKPFRPSTPRALAQPGSPLIPPVVNLGTPSGPNAVAINGGNNVAIGNSGPFGEFFGGPAASANERAVAHIVRIGGQPSPNQAPTTTGAGNNQNAVQNSPPGPTAALINGGARIGMAGFRDDPSGMVVMVDVGALPPGNYTVAISDPSVLGGAAVTGTGVVNPNVQAPSQLSPPQVPAPSPNGNGRFVPNGATPAPAGVRQPQGSLPPTRSIPRTILAQVAATADPTNANSDVNAVDTIPPTGEARPSTIPATGNVNPSSSTATGQSSVNNAQRAQMAKQAAGKGSAATLNQIGTITVDQSGTGRMQQTVESMQVRNVVGQAIVLYSQSGSPQTTLPANLNGSAGTATRQGVVDAPTANGSQRDTALNSGQAAGPQVPVAGGIIQLVTDRRPPATTGPQTSQTPVGTNGAVEQPASATPPAGQNLVR